MALEKNYEVEDGYTGNYWKISSITIDSTSKTSKVDVALYKDKATRDANKIPATAIRYNWEDAEFPFTIAAMDVDNPYVIAYAKLKTLDDFSGAIDV